MPKLPTTTICTLTAISLACCLLAPQYAAACSCAPTAVHTALESKSALEVGKAVKELRDSSETIFYGRVTAQHEIFNKDFHPQLGAGGSVSEFLVRHSWKGASSEKVEIKSGNSSCSPKLQIGRYYLIFASREHDGELSITICDIFFSEFEVPRSVVVALEELGKGTVYGPHGVSHSHDLIVDATDGRFVPDTLPSGK